MGKKTLQYLYWILAGTVLVLFFVGLAAFRNLGQAREYGQLVKHTTEVLFQSEAAISVIKDAETGVRGYLLTLNSKFLESYSGAATKVPNAVRRLDSLTMDNDKQRAPINRLKTLAERQLKIMDGSMSILVRTTNRDSLYQNLYQGKLVMDSIRTVIKQIQLVENNLLAERLQKENEFSALTPFWLGLISFLAIALFSASFFLVIQELRRRWRYEGDLEKAVDELKKTNAELENFVYLTTHHFQEPLRKLQTFSDRLTSKYRSALDAEAGFILDRIHSSAFRLQTLMDDLLLYLRYGGPLPPDEFQPVELVPFLNVLVAEQSKHRLPEKLPQLFWETLEVPAVSANRDQLQVLFAQLLDNSLKFAQENVKPVIKIRTFVTNGDQIRGLPTNRTKELFCHIEFRDNGLGFDMAHKDKIFQLFQRLHHNHEYPGTGIGLALCKKIMANHRGFLEVDSLPDVGTTMHLYLPFSRLNSSNATE